MDYQELTNGCLIFFHCSFIAGSFGLVALCAHTIAYNLIPLLFMIPLGISIGLTVRMGSVIAYDAERAKLMANWTMLFTATLGAAISFSLHFFQLPIIRLFTKDDDVILESQAIWPKLSYYVFILYIFGINGAILRGTWGYFKFCRVGSIDLFVSTPSLSFITTSLGTAVANGCDCWPFTLGFHTACCTLVRRTKWWRTGSALVCAANVLHSDASPSGAKLRHSGLAKTEQVDPRRLASQHLGGKRRRTTRRSNTPSVSKKSVNLS